MEILFIACKNGNKALVIFLVEHGTYINKKKEYGETSLFNAYESGNKSIVKYLIKHEAYINVTIGNGETPLFNECLNRNKYGMKSHYLMHV